MYLLEEGVVGTELQVIFFPAMLVALAAWITEKQQMDSAYDLWLKRNQIGFLSSITSEMEQRNRICFMLVFCDFPLWTKDIFHWAPWPRWSKAFCDDPGGVTAVAGVQLPGTVEEAESCPNQTSAVPLR
ncbi:gastrotropin isoform X4 [Columba livia]|uniref:gastrotropin isoform X4 n=1 Tax=Columba livia TaxID=8932 RepID=UPI0031BB8CD6